jgi:hypothetical protein
MSQSSTHTGDNRKCISPLLRAWIWQIFKTRKDNIWEEISQSYEQFYLNMSEEIFSSLFTFF